MYYNICMNIKKCIQISKIYKVYINTKICKTSSGKVCLQAPCQTINTESNIRRQMANTCFYTPLQIKTLCQIKDALSN